MEAASTSKAKVFVPKWGMTVERSIVGLLEKLENGDLSGLDDLSDYEDDENLLDSAECMEEKLMNVSRELTDEQENEIGEAPEGDEESEQGIQIEEEERGIQGEEEKLTEEDKHQDPAIEENVKSTEESKIRWTRKNVLDFPVREWQCPEEPSLNEDDILNPIEYFNRYVTSEIMNLFVEKTNIYALQTESARFKPTNKKEIETLIGLHLYMGCLALPRISMYWDNDLGLSVFRDSMSRNRFYKLRTNLHLVNNLERSPDDHDKFFKVRPIYNAIRKRCSELNVEKKVYVDEQICPFKGQLQSKQYMKGKPNPWGIKLFLLCGESGIFYDFVIYRGKTTEVSQALQKKYGQGAAVVIHLSRRISIPYTELYFDNYFTSYGLLQNLKSKKILGAGTARVNRFANPPFLSDKQIMKKERGYMEELYSTDQDVVMVKWLDNRIVSMSSNFIGIGQSDKVKRWDKASKKYIDIPRPEVIKKYNSSMGEVDKLDFLIGLYRVFVRSRKWTLRLIFHAIDMAICNSWLEYRKDCARANLEKKNILDLLHFKLEIANTLVKCGQLSSERKRGRPSTSRENSPIVVAKRRGFEVRPSSSIRLDTVDHLPVHNGQKEAGRCKNPGCTGKSHYKCEKCDIHLCLSKQKNCFRSFHTK